MDLHINLDGLGLYIVQIDQVSYFMQLKMSIMVNLAFLFEKCFIFYYIYDEFVLIEILSDDKMSVSSPRFSPDGKYLVWLQHPHGGPHQSAFALVKCDWETKNVNNYQFFYFIGQQILCTILFV